MKKAVLILSITLLEILLGSSVFGQVNNDGGTTGSSDSGTAECSLLAVSSTPVNLELATTGKTIKGSIADSSARLKISSVISGDTRTLSATVSAIPAGTSLTLQALNPNSNFDGTPGILLPATALSTSGTANIITGIESCNSGIDSDDGYLLKYTWALQNPPSKKSEVKPVASGATVVVTLTISAAL